MEVAQPTSRLGGRELFYFLQISFYFIIFLPNFCKLNSIRYREPFVMKKISKKKEKSLEL